jgi:hypothetical protein
MVRRVRLLSSTRAVSATVLAGALAVLLAAPGAATATTLSLHLARSPISSGRTVALTVAVSGAPAGSVVRVLAKPYPFRSARTIAGPTVSASGALTATVAVHPDRTTRYTASLRATGATATTLLVVSGRTVTRLQAISMGRADVRLVVYHPRDLRWGDARVRWWFAGPHGRFTAAPATETRRLSPYVTEAVTTATLPAGGYRFRACLMVPQAHALLDRFGFQGCPGRAYHGAGSLPVGFPGPSAIAAAKRYLRARGGFTGLAVVDSEGRLSGMALHQQFITGSVVKAMLLVAYLRRLGALGQRSIDPHSASFLYPMIHISDNAAATETQSYVGDAGLYSVARAAGMTGFSVSGSWGTALLTPADQARFFFEMDSLIPSQFVDYARYLFSTIAGYESWGIPAIGRPLGYQVFFKGGWRPSPRVYLVNQIARLEGHGRTFSIAVMTDGDPDMGYGVSSITGVARILLR